MSDRRNDCYYCCECEASLCLHTRTPCLPCYDMGHRQLDPIKQYEMMEALKRLKRELLHKS